MLVSHEKCEMVILGNIIIICLIGTDSAGWSQHRFQRQENLGERRKAPGLD